METQKYSVKFNKNRVQIYDGNDPIASAALGVVQDVLVRAEALVPTADPQRLQAELGELFADETERFVINTIAQNSYLWKEVIPHLPEAFQPRTQ